MDQSRNSPELKVLPFCRGVQHCHAALPTRCRGSKSDWGAPHFYFLGRCSRDMQVIPVLQAKRTKPKPRPVLCFHFSSQQRVATVLVTQNFSNKLNFHSSIALVHGSRERVRTLCSVNRRTVVCSPPTNHTGVQRLLPVTVVHHTNTCPVATPPFFVVNRTPRVHKKPPVQF